MGHVNRNHPFDDTIGSQGTVLGRNMLHPPQHMGYVCACINMDN